MLFARAGISQQGSHAIFAVLRAQCRPFARVRALRNIQFSTHPKQARPPPSPPSFSKARSFAQRHPYLIRTISILIWYPALDFIFTNIFQIMSVRGPSMYPFLNTDADGSSSMDRVLVNMYRPSQHLHRGEVVAFWSPLHPEKMAVKRVVALAGDVVETRAPYPFARETVPPGHCWVEGEHPEGSRKSYDSNTYGPVSLSLIVGNVKAVVWPWRRAGRIRWEDWGGSRRVTQGAGEMREVVIYSP